MTASSRIPEFEGLDVVAVGSFNPAIFHPDFSIPKDSIHAGAAERILSFFRAEWGRLAQTPGVWQKKSSRRSNPIMFETDSTSEVPVQWLDRIDKGMDRIGTRFFLFSQAIGDPHESGHVVVREQSEAVPEAKTRPSGTNTSEEGIPTSHTDPMRLPRARRLNPPSIDRYILLKKFESGKNCSFHSHGRQ